MKFRIRSGKGTLFIVSGLLISSGLIRLGGDAATALALGVEEASAGSEVNEPADAMPSLQGVPSELAAALLAREIAVSEKEQRLEDRLKALAIAEEEISLRINELREAEQSLQSVIFGAEAASNDDLARLTSVYENMKPVDASALFEQMEPSFAAGFIAGMRSDAAAAILAGLEPQTAYAISVILAGRNAEVPTE